MDWMAWKDGLDGKGGTRAEQAERAGLTGGTWSFCQLFAPFSREKSKLTDKRRDCSDYFYIFAA
jgi:hypothetical protein